ncbi:MAG: radical SAM family heme chaperone HemW, partial [Anaerolineales bacterium]
MGAYSLYLHIPFCRHRCAYCDFNTYAGIESQIPAYVDALCREIRITSESSGRQIPVHSVFFGGGTPSLLEIDQVAGLLGTIGDHYHLLAGAEITLEANPGTLSPAYLQTIRQSGINRLSLGMQSGRIAELHLLERQHNYFDIVQSVKWARQAGFDNINLDMIFGLPYQTLEEWQQSLQRAVSLQPEHLAVYSLILEDGTPMKRWVERGLIDNPDADIAAEMYEWACDYLDIEGYHQYEISNWARKNGQGRFLSCRHNLQYWRMEPYFGFGAGAHGFVDGFHTANVALPFKYTQLLTEQETTQELAPFPKNPATEVIETLDSPTEMSEVMLMGLRLTEEGVSSQDFSRRFGISLWDAYRSTIERLLNLGLVEVVQENGERLRLTKRGRLLGNRVFIEFIDES